MRSPNSLSFDQIASRYDATRGGDARGRVIAKVIDPWLPAEGRVLEIGVGTAVVATAIAAMRSDVVGVDLSGPMLAVAASRFGGPLLNADASALPFRDGQLAAVYGVWVLHLVGDQAAVLAECHRVLRTGGRLVAVVTDETRRVGPPQLVALERRYRHRTDALAHLDPLAAAAGFRRIHVEPMTPFGRPMPAADLADHLEQRTWSWLWDVAPAAWEEEVVPVIAELRAQPDGGEPVVQQVANQMVVWER